MPISGKAVLIRVLASATTDGSNCSNCLPVYQAPPVHAAPNTTTTPIATRDFFITCSSLLLLPVPNCLTAMGTDQTKGVQREVSRVYAIKHSNWRRNRYK